MTKKLRVVTPVLSVILKWFYDDDLAFHSVKSQSSISLFPHFLKFERFCDFLKRINFDLFLYVGKYLKIRHLKFYIFICDSKQLRLESRLLLFGQIL